MTLDTLQAGFQTQGTLVGLEDRLELLKHLSEVLTRRPDYFSGEEGHLSRPGNMMGKLLEKEGVIVFFSLIINCLFVLSSFLDYLLSHPTTIKTKKGPLIHLETLWPIVFEMGELWTENGQSGGDIWPCPALEGDTIVFHKLSQWMVYSLIEPMEKLLGAIFEGTEQLTPLSDYANGKSLPFLVIELPFEMLISKISTFSLRILGGLLIDTGFITLKQKDHQRGIENYRQNALLPGQPKIEVTPMFELSDPVVVEWRALTVAYMDLLAERVRSTLKMNKKSLSLSQLIEGGTTSVKYHLNMVSKLHVI